MTPSAYWVRHVGFVETIVIEYKGSQDEPDPDISGWGIYKRGFVWDDQAKDWIDEPMPSNRDDRFKKSCRFTLAEAERIAKGNEVTDP